jgi:hypothetical protein
LASAEANKPTEDRATSVSRKQADFTGKSLFPVR